MRRALKQIIVFALVLTLFSSFALAIDGCCEKTKKGDWCAFVDQKDCNANSKFSPAYCEQTSYCQVGCCYSSDSGRCFKNSPQASCQQGQGYTWGRDASCNIKQCNLGCCILGDQASFITKVQCKKTASQFAELKMQFDDTITTEAKCIEKAKNQDQGCCVKSDKTCSFTTRKDCASSGVDVQVANKTNYTKKAGFYKDLLCSNDRLPCACAKQQDTACLGEDVYWVDSCGNRENIYDRDKKKSYNNGFVLKESVSCKASGAYDTACGNCDYPTGTVCGKDIGKKMPIGKNTCVDLNCKEVYEDDADYSPNAEGSKKNGESWCIYDSVIGQGRDTVGSRHYKHLCINGEEQVESCKDYREELCIQGVLKEETLTLLEAFMAQGDYVEAACRPNRWKTCSACTDIENYGKEIEQFWDKEEDEDPPEELIDKMKECCINEDIHDCYWLKGGVSDFKGTCIPQVPPGLKFWTSTPASALADISSTAGTTTKGKTSGSTPTSKAEQQCAVGSKKCTVHFQRGGWERIFDSDDWEAMTNENCTSHDWIVSGNTVCKSLGDCGAYFNVLGVLTKDGYENTAIYEKNFFKGSKLTDKEAGDWKTLISKPTDSPDKPSLWGKVGKNPAIWAGWIALGSSSLISGAWAGSITSGGFWDGFANGVNPLQNTVLGGIGKTGMVGKVFTSSVTTDSLNKLGVKGVQKGFAMKAGQKLGAKDLVSKVYGDNLRKALGNKVYDKAYNEALSGAIQKSGNQNLISAVQGKSADQVAAYLKNVPAGDKITSSAITKAQQQASKKVIENEASNIAGKAGLEKSAEGTFVNSASGGAGLMSAINTVLWAYQIYSMVDLLATQTEEVTYEIKCQPWVAPWGSDDCEKCNDKWKPCSEYKCKSLGQSCELVNKGTANETCISLNPNDANSPIIKASTEPMISPYNKIEETSSGYSLKNKVPAFTPVRLGLTTDEPAQCKYSITPGIRFKKMTQFFGGSSFKYNHTAYLSLPSILTSRNATVKNKGEYSLYVRCQDASKNANERDYFIKFKVDATPDHTAPLIKFTSLIDGAFISFNSSTVPMTIYVDEPADCSWSTRDTDFSKMENKFSCEKTPMAQSTLYYGTYACKSTIKNLKNKRNKIFIRCKDQPNAPDDKRNYNTESYKLTLEGSSKRLKITSALPTGTLFKQSAELQVTTSGGAQYGKAVCAFSAKDVPFASMVAFLNTSSTTHKQTLTNMPKGSYFYYIKCVDQGGNSDTTNVSFKVDFDSYAPKISLLYKDIDYNSLYLETDEQTTCEYSNTVSTFKIGEGTSFGQANTTVHETSLGSGIYYVKCKDKFGNEATYTINL